MPNGKIIFNNNQIIYNDNIKIPTKEQFDILLSAPLVYCKTTYRNDIDLVEEMKSYTYENRQKHYYYSTPKLPTAKMMLWYYITQTVSMSLQFTGTGSITPALSTRTYINMTPPAIENAFIYFSIDNDNQTQTSRTYYTMRYFDNAVYAGYKNVSDSYTAITYNTNNVASYIDILAIQAYPQYTPVTVAHITIDTTCQYLAIDSLA